MKRKIYIAILTVFAIFAVSCSYCFANNTTSSAVDGIRNVVGGAENVVEDVGKGVSEGIKNVIDAGKNTMENMTSGKNVQNTRTTNNTNYTATRTTARTTSAGNTGINSTMWTWIIMAIVGIVIIALVWMYAKQNNTYNNKNNNY